MDQELLFAADTANTLAKPLALRCAAGELVRIRRGVYVGAAAWAHMPRWERDRLRIVAALESGSGSRVLLQESAAAMWGIPVIGSPPEVLLLASDSSHGRRRGDLRWTRRKLLEPLACRDGVQLTSRAQTVIDMAAYLPFEQAVPAMDHVLRPDPTREFPSLSKDYLHAVASQLPDRAKHSRAVRVIDFADARSESPGESFSRAILHKHGFPAPELQHEFRSAGGRFLGRTDFYWPEQKLVGEFDGAVKYGRGTMAFPSGKSMPPSWETLTREKQREDAIRATGVRFIRWSWNDVTGSPQDPEGLVQCLVRAGLPRKRGGKSAAG
ncbi:endonuclease domain-containing protein [Arthrobacter sp. zg-Y40]|uniref:endonuclease domain-containing protein n=1 Tax=Arthrobacter sp. zg-Y40 TaxID=2886939 RepID=UPI001D137129|nr:endonuclease domain-containing protein [Arthrobacter sp. zg-Y40]MCC3280666.1 endonuclease domain-containing protein [Arthrobacter sp. zg-Y40]